MTTAQEIIRKLWLNGMSDGSIAVAIGRSRSSILKIRHLKQSGKQCQAKLVKLWLLTHSDE